MTGRLSEEQQMFEQEVAKYWTVEDITELFREAVKEYAKECDQRRVDYFLTFRESVFRYFAELAVEGRSSLRPEEREVREMFGFFGNLGPAPITGNDYMSQSVYATVIGRALDRAAHLHADGLQPLADGYRALEMPASVRRQFLHNF
jgi:hypothetical protein